MKKARFLVTAMAFAASSPALAAGWGVQTTITGFYIDPALGRAWLKTANNQNIDSCAASNYLAISTADTHFKELYATMMTAHVLDTTVSMYYNGCLGGYPPVTSIAMPNVW